MPGHYSGAPTDAKIQAVIRSGLLGEDRHSWAILVLIASQELLGIISGTPVQSNVTWIDLTEERLRICRTELGIRFE